MASPGSILRVAASAVRCGPPMWLTAMPCGRSPTLTCPRAGPTGFLRSARPNRTPCRHESRGPVAGVAPPTILLGGTLATASYWHGPARTKWARDWVRLWTDGKDDLYTVSMEQAMYVGTLQRTAAQGLVDFSRVMMLRTASNYTMPPPG